MHKISWIKESIDAGKINKTNKGFKCNAVLNSSLRILKKALVVPQPGQSIPKSSLIGHKYNGVSANKLKI